MFGDENMEAVVGGMRMMSTVGGGSRVDRAVGCIEMDMKGSMEGTGNSLLVGC